MDWEGGRVLSRILKKIRWADNNLFASLMKVLYYNIVKKNRFAIFELDLTQKFESPSLDPQHYNVRVMDYKELASLIAGKENLPREFYMHEIDGVRYCVIITSGDRIGHISWIYLKGDQDRWFDLLNEEAHVNYSFTFSEYRGMAFFPQALLAAAEWLKARKYQRILMDVHMETIFMLNSMKKINGVRRIGTLTQWFVYRPKFRRKNSPILGEPRLNGNRSLQ